MSYAQQLARRGFCVFPCEVNGKKPLVKWRDVSTTDEEEIELLDKQFPDCNWGIDCGKSELFALDVDNKKENGYETLKAMEINKGYVLPETLEFSTPSGGRHYIFKGVGKTTAGKVGPGLDTRGVGGYIVAPGSTLGGGKRYTVLQNRPIADAPAWLIRLTESDSDKPIIKTESDVELDRPHDVQEAVHYLEKRAKPAIEGEGGDAQTFKVAAQLKDLGISQDTAVELMVDFWNDKCEPPWDFEELNLKIRNAYNYSQNSPGAKTAQAAFEIPVESAFKTTDIEPFKYYNFAEMLAPAPPLEWLLEGWIPHQEQCLITGKEGVGKSLIALQLAVSAAYGVPWLGQDLGRTYKVVYISCEDNKKELNRRCNAINKLPEYAFLESSKLDPERFRTIPLIGEDTAMVYEEGRNQLKAGMAHKRLTATLDAWGWRDPLIILDTLSDMYMANENVRTMVNRYVKGYLARFVLQYGATIVTLAHPPKDETKDYSGSTAWPAAHRSCIGVKNNPSGVLPNHRIVELWKGNYTTTEGKTMHVEWNNGSFRRVNVFDIPELANAAENDDKERVYDFIEDWARNQGTPVAVTSNSTNYIGKSHMTIHDIEGVPMDVSKKVHLAQVLQAEGRLKEVVLLRKSGLVPTEEEK